MATTKGRLALSFVTVALAAGSLYALTPQQTLRETAAAERLLANRTQLGLDADHAFQIRLSLTDELGQTHHHAQQLYKGVRVWGGDIIAHTAKNGAELPHTNALHKNIRLNVTPALAEAEALAAVHGDLNPKGSYSHAPTAELVIYPELVDVVRPGRHADRNINAEDVTHQVLHYTLAYHIHTELENSQDGIKHTDYMVDAHTGALLTRWNTLHTSAAIGTGNSQYSGVISLNTNSITSGYELRDMTRGTGGNFVSNAAHAADTSTATGTIYTDADNTWGDGANYVEGSSTTAANGQTAAVDAMYGMAKTWDMYKQAFGRNGIDGSGTGTYSRVHVSNGYDNAFWSDSCFCMTYGDGTSFTTLTAIDVAGHEMSHGVTANSVPGGLTYSGESGGLNEGNSDIFGTMVEFYAHGGGTGGTIPATGGNWTMGEQLASTPLRYLYKPSKDGTSPDAWYSGIGSLDVHYSMGPNIRMFYFLSQGASATSSSDFYSSYTPAGFAGIGNDHAARIQYRALTTYYTSGETYAQARTALISAAKDLYTAGSPEEQAVWNSFAAINVGAAWTVSTDTTAPTATASETGTTGTITLSATATDNVGVTKVEFYIDGALVGTDTTSPYSVTYNSALLVNGSHGLVAKAYDAAGNVGTSTTVTFSVSNTTSGAELVVNGGFESGATSWTQTTGVIGAFTGEPAHTGSNDAWMCGYGAAHTDYIYQQIAIPTTATGTLTFWLHVDTAETTTTTAYDTMKVQVLNTAGTVLATLATYSNLDKNTGYTQKSLNLSAYKGTTVRLRFYSVEDSSLQSSFVVDDVSVK